MALLIANGGQAVGSRIRSSSAREKICRRGAGVKKKKTRVTADSPISEEGGQGWIKSSSSLVWLEDAPEIGKVLRGRADVPWAGGNRDAKKKGYLKGIS